LYKQKLQDVVVSEFHKTCDVLHFLEIREMSGIFSTFIEHNYNVLPISSAATERRFSKKLHTLNNG